MGEKLFISLANVLRKNKRRLILIRKKANMPEEDNCITKKDWTYRVCEIKSVNRHSMISDGAVSS